MDRFPTPIYRIGAKQTIERLQAENIPIDSVKTDPVTGRITVQLPASATDAQRKRAEAIAAEADIREYRPLSEAEQLVALATMSEEDLNKTLRWMAADFLRRNPHAARQLGLGVPSEVPVES